MRLMSTMILLVCLISLPNQVFAQDTRTRETEEFIESRSPLKSGGFIVSRSEPGRKVQTRTIIENPPVAPGRAVTSNETAQRTPASTVPNRANAYPYPAATQPRQNQLANRQTRQTAYQVPTLGLRPVARTAQNCNCAPVPPQTYQTPGYAAPGYAPANTVPSLGGVPNLNIQVPGQQGFAQPGFQSQTQTFTPNYQFQQGVGTPQFGATNYGAGSSWLTPFLTGTGTYTPLLNFRNLPPGSHLGQGIIGQPTAYVDGQPVRNLLRYIAP